MITLYSAQTESGLLYTLNKHKDVLSLNQTGLANSVCQDICHIRCIKKLVSALFLYSLFFFLSCQSKVNTIDQELGADLQADQCITIDIASNLKDSGEKMLLSDIVEDVEYIKLETSNVSLLGTVWNVQVVGNYLFIRTLGEGQSAQIKMFDRSGKFIRSLGKIGQGPGEYLLSRSFCCDDSMLYINTNELEKVFVYDWRTGKYVHDIPLKKQVDEINSLTNNCISIHQSLTADLYREKTSLTVGVVSENGKEKFIQRIIIPEKFNSCLSGKGIRSVASSWVYKNIVNQYEFNNDTIYGVTSDSVYPRYKIDFGKYKMSLCDYYDDEILFYTKDGMNYAQTPRFIETDSYLYIDFSYDYKKWIARYNKTDQSITCWAQKINYDSRDVSYKVYGGGFENDVNGSFTPLWKQLRGGYLWQLVDMGVIEEQLTPKHFAETSAKYPEKKAELMKLVNEFGEDDNPIIILYKLK